MKKNQLEILEITKERNKQSLDIKKQTSVAGMNSRQNWKENS